MKNIYVTITEFINNGGKIQVGRELFSEDLYSKEIVSVGKYKNLDADGYIVFEKPDGFHDEDGDEYLFVQIDCTPIYA